MNELGHPVVQEFPPGRSGISHFCPTVIQDAAGFIYIGNGTQARCYDGTTWWPIALPSESAGIRRFVLSSDGTVFLGGAGVIGFLCGAGEGTKFVSLAGRLPPTELGCDEIQDVGASGSAVYFSDEEKILRWQDGRFITLRWRSRPHGRGARLHRVGAEMYVTALDCPLGRVAGERVEIVADEPAWRENTIVSLEPMSGGALLVLTAERGFFRYQGGRLEPEPLEANRWLDGRTVRRSLRLGDGSLVVSFAAPSGDGGLRLDAAGRYQGPIDNSIGLYVKTLRDFFRDREGGLWLATETGMFRLEWPSASTVFDGVNGLGLGRVNDVVRHEGALYVATTEGVFQLAPADASGKCARFDRIQPQPVYALVSHPGGLLALGYAEVLVLAGGRFVPVAGIAPGGGVLAQSRCDQDRVWVGTTRGLAAIRHSTGGWTSEGKVSGIDDDCQGVVEELSGAVWIAALDRGLVRVEWGGPVGTLHAPQSERFSGGRGLPENFSRVNLACWAGEPVFFVSGSTRPFRFDPQARRFVAVAGTAQLPPVAPTEAWIASEPDAAGPLASWIASASGIYRVTAGEGPAHRLPQMVADAVGPVTRLLVEAGGDRPVLWVGGGNGLVRLEQGRATAEPVSVATQLRSSSVQAGESLGPDHAPVSFHYATLRHQAGSSVVHQTRLAGFERDWTAWSARSERVFPHLPAGQYHFEVRARTADGGVGAIAVLAFAVRAPWWGTVWAILGYVLAGSGLVAGVVRVRTAALRRRAERLEAIVAARTGELAEKNLELIRLNRREFDEKTAARLGEEKARLEVLRYQLNPHFLFNTLASISSVLPIGHSTARTMLERLADFCRLTLHRPEAPEATTLGEEFALLRTYLEIELSRCGDRLEVEISCDPSLASVALPYFLLLPLVENALKYGRRTSPDRLGVRLFARRGERGALNLEVANTGRWVEPIAGRCASTSLGIGLENLRERLARSYPGGHTLTVTQENGWVRVILTLAQDRGAAPPAVIPRPE